MGSKVENVNSPEYAGCVAVVVPDQVRVVVSGNGVFYVLQWREERDGIAGWYGAKRAKSRSRLLALYAGQVPGLAVACDGLPESPVEAAPELVALRAAQAAAFDANDWRLDGYARELVRAGNVRLAVCSNAVEYLVLQRSHEGAAWRKIAGCADRDALCGFVRKSKRVADRQPLLTVAEKLPLSPASGVWPVLPERPVPVKQQRRA